MPFPTHILPFLKSGRNSGSNASKKNGAFETYFSPQPLRPSFTKLAGLNRAYDTSPISLIFMPIRGTFL